MTSKDQKVLTKYITVTYRSDGNVEVESNDMNVFDLWALSNYIKMRADEQYITVQTAQRTKDAAKNAIRPLQIATKMPRES